MPYLVCSFGGSFVMPMILGIAVDDTIHMNNHIKYGFERTGSYRHSLLLSIVGLGAALIADYTLTTALVYLSKPYRIAIKNARKTVSGTL